MRTLRQKVAQAGLGVAVALLGAACQETPIWTSEPVPLLHAIAVDDRRVVVEWLEGGADLARPLSLQDVGVAVPTSLASQATATPLAFAVAARRTPLAMLLAQHGAALGSSGPALVCQVALSGEPDDMRWLAEHGASVKADAQCADDDQPLSAVAARNSDAMAQAVNALTGKAAP